MTRGTHTIDETTNSTLDAIAHGLAYPSRSPVLRTPAAVGLEFEEVSYPSSDGTPLEAWIIPCQGSDKLIVAMHAFGFNRYGFASHLEPFKSAFGPGNDTEIDFLLDYEILPAEGYNVLAFDFRNSGLSGAANGGVASNNHFETRDIFGTLDYIHSRPELAAMTLGLFARCMGANVTFRAIDENPAAFVDVRCLVAPLLLSPGAFLRTSLDAAGLSEYVEEVDRRFRAITGVSTDGGRTSAWAPAVTMPTLTYGVHDDVITTPSDLEETYEAIGASCKSMFWIQDTPRRWDGYKYFQRQPGKILAWFGEHMN